MMVVEIVLSKPISPADIRPILSLVPNAPDGVVISGRLPVWLFCALAHHYHPTRFVAVYDPRLAGAVIVESHDPTRNVGDVIPLEDYEQLKTKIEY